MRVTSSILILCLTFCNLEDVFKSQTYTNVVQWWSDSGFFFKEFYKSLNKEGLKKYHAHRIMLQASEVYATQYGISKYMKGFQKNFIIRKKKGEMK